MRLIRRLLPSVLFVLALPTIALAAEPGALRTIAPIYGPVPGAGVRVAGERGSFVYVVQGAPQTIRGMGYNTPLSSLSEADRRQRFDRDFPLMRRVGVNTILGWDQAGFDRTLLDSAQAYGLGVIVHFDLGKSWDYGDAALRAKLLEQVAGWVDAYRDHPAVRMWGIGNEAMLNMNAEESRQFADFYVQLYSTVREHDALHPVLYREAEDARVGVFRDAFAAADVPPSNFVFGMNFYTPRLADALAEYATLGFDVPVLISEFAPAGVAPAARAAAFRDLWLRVLPFEQFVVGVAPYAWTTDGPEAVDRLFGLTDGQGHPVDATLGALQRIYRGPVPVEDLLPAPRPPTRATLGVGLDRGMADALARAVAQPGLDPIDLAAIRAVARERFARDLAVAPGAARADRRVMDRMLDLLVDASALAALRQGGQPMYPGAIEALPLLAGMGRWAAIDPSALPTAEAFLTEVVTQTLRLPPGAPVPTP
jgi:hypothetical protein